MLAEGIAGLADRRMPVIVVGSGPVGLALATELAAQGVAVLVLESGDTRANSRIQALSDAQIADPARHDDMSIAVARRLGGTSNLWGARCLPYDPIDFAKRDYCDANWPIGYDDLAPYWARAARATCSGEPVYDDEGLPFAIGETPAAFTTHRVERWANIQAAQDVHKATIRDSRLIELRTLATVTDLVFAEDGRIEAVVVAHSLTGETVTIAADHVVLAGGGLESTRLLLAAQRAAPERFGGTEGPLGRYYMGHLMDEIADVVFTSAETARAFTFMVDRHGSYVRRRIVPSDALQRERGLLNSAFWPQVPAIADARHRSAVLSTVFLGIAFPPVGRLLISEAIRKRHVPQGVPILPHLGNVISDLPAAARFAVDYWRRRHASDTRLPGFFIENRSHRYGLGFHAEQAPNAASRVRISQDFDRLGLPTLAIDLRFGDRDAASLIRTHELLETWMIEARLGHIEYRVAREDRHSYLMSKLSHGTHQIGTARMGGDRRSAVVDADLACFDSPNLHVASTAVLPTSGQANPTFTAVALAIRLADRLKRLVAGAALPVRRAMA